MSVYRFSKYLKEASKQYERVRHHYNWHKHDLIVFIEAAFSSSTYNNKK